MAACPPCTFSAWWLSLLLLGCVCVSGGAAESVEARPDTREVIELVLGLRDVPLSRHESCAHLGVHPCDSTIGDFLMSVWAFHADTTGTNFIDVICTDIVAEAVKDLIPEAVHGREFWSVEFSICRHAGEEHWCWGIMFLVSKKDRAVIPGSVRCNVAG
jgi:hypothetical protein